MDKRLTRQLAAACLVFLLAACGPTPVVTRTPIQFEFAVSGSADSLVQDLAAGYHAAHPHISFKLDRGIDSAQALDRLQTGQAELAAVSWLTVTQPVWMTAVALDGIAVVVHPSNPINNLTMLGLRDVFRGRTAEWQDAGGPPVEVAAVTREVGSGTRTKFEEAVMEGRALSVNALVAASERGVIDYVRTMTGAIGYVSSAYLTSTVKAISVEGVPLSLSSIAERRYPLTRPILFVTPEEPQGELRDFVAWVLSPEGQTIVSRKMGKVK